MVLYNLIDAMKKLNVQTIESASPCNFIIGWVVSVSPLKIQVDQKLIISEEFLILTRNVTDFEVDMTVDHLTEKAVGGSGYAMYASHEHQYKGRKKFTVHNALKVGENVLMGRVKGGQQYIIIDRV